MVTAMEPAGHALEAVLEVVREGLPPLVSVLPLAIVGLGVEAVVGSVGEAAGSDAGDGTGL